MNINSVVTRDCDEFVGGILPQPEALPRAKNADALVAFWDGMSLGTRHMIEIARSRGLKVRVKRYDKESGVRW